MKNQKYFGHQGDVQFIETKLPAGCKKIDKKPVALGEHSGHQHIFTGDYELFEDELSNLYVSVGNAGAVLQHIHESNFRGYDSKELQQMADHKPVELKPNTTLKIGIHKKFNPFSKIWEQVQD